MSSELDYENSRYCAVYDKDIDADLCYNSLMCLNGSFKISSTKELLEVKDIESAKVKCKNCPFSSLE